MPKGKQLSDDTIERFVEVCLCLEEVTTLKYWQKSCNKFTMDSKFERIVLKSSPFHYMKVKLDFLGAKANVDSDIFKSVIVQALSELHGDVGAAMSLDVLYFDRKAIEGIIRVPSKGLVKIWSALTLFSSYGDKKCIFKVNKVSPHLASLSVDSRHFLSQLLAPK